MLRVGLTGGIGSGKSTVARIFETLGVPVYYADTAAKRLMNESNVLRKQITEAFGESAYKGTTLNREYLSNIVFKNPEQLQLLNSLVHPATINDAALWLNQQVTPYAIKEAALIFEAGANKDLDYVIGVSSPEKLRIQRIIKRDQITPGEVKDRMDKQMKEEEKMKLCDFIIINDETQIVITQVTDLHKKLTALSANPSG